MTSTGFLSLQAHNAATSPVGRGHYVRSRLLCQDIPPPPANAPALPPPSAQGPQTMRMRLAQHTTSTACSPCHRMMDPSGLSLENFDALGVYRQSDQGLPIDASGQLDGITFEGGRELGRLLHDDARVTACVVRTLMRHSLGQVGGAELDAPIAQVAGEFSSKGNRFSELVRALVRADAFHYGSACR